MVTADLWNHPNPAGN